MPKTLFCTRSRSVIREKTALVFKRKEEIKGKEGRTVERKGPGREVQNQKSKVRGWGEKGGGKQGRRRKRNDMEMGCLSHLLSIIK